jgi:hypothetical protein
MDVANTNHNPNLLTGYSEHLSDTPTVYVPAFKGPSLALARSSGDYTVCKKLFSDSDWVTPDLRRHIETLFPSCDSINSGTRVRDKVAFMDACSVLFKKGRIFSSQLQLKQVATLFLDKWGGQCSKHGKKIVCYYHAPMANKKEKVDLPNRKVYKVKESQKSLIKCPFEIRYSLIECVVLDKVPEICHEIKITYTNFEHTCELSPVYLREAKRRGGHLKLDIPSLKSALDLLRLHPNTETRILRPYLVRALPNWHALDSAYVANFRKRAIKHWSLHGHSDDEHSDFTMTEAESLVSAPSAADDIIDLDDVTVRTNYEKLLRRVMQESSETWKVKKYLDDCRAQTPGFQFVIDCDEEGRPVCITWATPRMLRDLLRFSDIIFLDAQCRQFNAHHFPYSSVVMINDENKICNGCEALFIEERTDTYEKMIQALKTMEPRWDASGVKLLFGDMKVTQKLLDSAGLYSCRLRGDMWHLLNEVWPHQHSFGRTAFDQIGNFLRLMVTCETEAEWEFAYQSARKVLADDPEKCSKLDAIHSNPSYYSGHILHDMEGSLGKKGDSHAEQNHSSIVAHLGKGGTLNLAEQVCGLLNRHKSNTLRRQQAEWALTITASKYKSTYRSPTECRDDVLAKQALSMFAYKKYTESLQHARRLQVSENNEGLFTVWPVNASIEETSISSIHRMSRTKRCPCNKRKQLLVQCGHELKVFGFQMPQWSNRWLSNATYCEKVQNLFQTGFFSQVGAGAITQPIDEEDESDDFIFETSDECTAEVIEMVIGRPVMVVGKDAEEEKEEIAVTPVVTYSEVVSTFSAIVSHAQHNQPELLKLHAFAKGVLNSYRKGLSVNLEFSTDGQANQVPTATSKVLPTASRKKRNKSYLEFGRNNAVAKRAKVGAVTTNFRDQSNQELNTMVARKGKGTKKCSLCGLNKGHTAFTCDLLHQYGKSLPRSDQTSRMSLISDLVNNQRFVVESIAENDARPALKSLPSRVSAMILHRKCRLGRQMVIETTLIRNGCIDEEFTSVLFVMDAINAWLPTSRSKPVVNLIAIERFNSTSLSQQMPEQPPPAVVGMTADHTQQSCFSHQQQSQPHLSQQSQNSTTHNPIQALFWNRMNSNPMQSSLDQRLAHVSNLMLSQGSQAGTQAASQPNVFDFRGGHL